MDIRPLTDDFAVAPQIDPSELPQIKAAGYASILCNRPDGEEPGQPNFATIEAAAKAEGLEVAWVPIVSGMVTPEALTDFASALEDMPKPILAYCRSGTRCTMLWTIARHGTLPDTELQARTAQAGYDMSGLLRQLQGR
ncbi:TIGR01244 family sulfur transferase [Roseovarius aestuariivivens]|uniref:TIGR01244 family sulfur transferase n=1 Tax=Roseovarius aestuariivivens TaxID=1888910 RepID=UPI001080E0C3|nr:TIGR01244 family sulfur transferase [Roseovarius aestuariivivens]